MLDALKRFFLRHSDAADWSEASDWAAQHGFDLKHARDNLGFVIDGALDGKPWRLEWGPPQRSYIRGRELRFRMELHLPPDVRMLLLSLPLMEALERQTYERVTHRAAARIETSTPEEMRWLMMYAKADLSRLKAVREHFGAVAGSPAQALAWVEGPLSELLARAADGWLGEAPPFLLMTFRGRAYMRMQLAKPDAMSLAGALTLFEAAVTQALRVANERAASRSVWPAADATAWQNILSEEPTDPQRL
jgi:hypothetical protein